MSFYGGQLKQQICYSFTLLISYMVFNPLKMAVQFFWALSSFPNFDGPNAFSRNSTGPWPRLQKGRKITVDDNSTYLSTIWISGNHGCVVDVNKVKA